MSALAVLGLVAVIALGLRERRRRAEAGWGWPTGDGRWWSEDEDGNVAWHDSPTREPRGDA